MRITWLKPNLENCAVGLICAVLNRKMTVKYTFIYVSAIFFAHVIVKRGQSPNLDPFAKILHVLSRVGFYVLCAFLIFHSEVLENKA